MPIFWRNMLPLSSGLKCASVVHAGWKKIVKRPKEGVKKEELSGTVRKVDCTVF
jgi:hypothetical protein